jgi:hypothetical protein
LKSPITLAEILEMVRINADVPNDFEEYCEFVGLKEKEIFLFFNSLYFFYFITLSVIKVFVSGQY